MIRPLYLFDIDGTLSDTRWRVPILRDGSPRRWDRFFAAAADDPPIAGTLHVLHALIRSGAECRLHTGRPERYRKLTVNWLHRHTSYPPAFWHPILQMRPDHDFTVDVNLKLKWLEAWPEDDRKRFVAAFEDRPEIVAAYRQIGLTVFDLGFYEDA